MNAYVDDAGRKGRQFAAFVAQLYRDGVIELLRARAVLDGVAYRMSLLDEEDAHDEVRELMECLA